jgi:mannosyltransferase
MQRRADERREWVLAICGLTALMGVFTLGAKSIWHDEAFSAAVARLGFPTMWRVITRGDTFNGLYYTVLHLWVHGGVGETWLRLPSVIFGIFAVGALFVLNRRLFGTPVGVVSSLLLAINTFFVQYDQEARTYALAVLLVVLATYLLTVALDRPSIWRWVVYGAVCALAVYAHFFAAFVITTHILSFPLARRRPRLGHVVAAYGVTAILVAPLLTITLRADTLQRPFIPKPTLGSLQSLFLNLTGGGGLRATGPRLLLVAYFVACSVAVLAIGKAFARRLRSAGGDQTWQYGLAFLWLVVPVVGSFSVSLIWTPIFLARYLIVVLPALVTIAAIGIASLPNRVFQGIALVTVVALTIPPLISYYRSDFKNGEDWRSAVRYVIQGEQPGDGVVFLDRYGRRPFEYYLRGSAGPSDLTPIYPGVPWGQYVPVLADLRIESTTVAAARLGQSYQRVWVILLWRGFESIHEDATPMRAALARDFNEVSERAFGSELRVRLYERSG